MNLYRLSYTVMIPADSTIYIAAPLFEDALRAFAMKLPNTELRSIECIGEVLVTGART